MAFDPTKPFKQSNTFVTSGQEDSYIQKLQQYETTPYDQQQYIAEYNPLEKRLAKRPDQLSSKIAASLSIIDALIPEERITNFHPVQPQEIYNPHPYGTGSQALFANGGKLSSSKAKEMLKDGTANGKKLTKKQKQYFGMVASGKAAVGATLDPMPKGAKVDSLPEVTVHGFKNPSTRAFYDKILRDDPTVYLGLMNLGEKYGFSTVKETNDGGDVNFAGQTEAEYNPLINKTTIYQANKKDSFEKKDNLIDELAHKVQFDKNPVKSTVNGMKGAIKSLFNVNPYTDKSSHEYEAHSIIAPKLMDEFDNYYNSQMDIEDREREERAAPKGKKKKAQFGMQLLNKGSIDPILDVKPAPSLMQMKRTKDGDMMDIIDSIHMSLGTGNNFIHDVHGKKLMDKGRGLYGEKDTQGLIDMISTFNQRSDINAMSTQQKVSSFYDMNKKNPLIQKFNSVSYGPQSLVNNTPDMDVRNKYASMKNGGKIQSNQVETHWGGNAVQESDNPYDGGTTLLQGDSHKEGGIGLSYGSNMIEAEGGEPIINFNGDMHIMGNMKIPGTKTKFKQAVKKIADQENKYDKIKTIGTQLVNQSDPTDKWDQLKFNSGEVMMKGGDMGQKDLVSKKQQLATLQQAILETAAQHNLDPEHLSEGKVKKAKKGLFTQAASGALLSGDPTPKKQSMAQRHNNPGNLKFAKWQEKYGAVRGEKGTDGGYFAKFPDTNSGLNALTALLKDKTYQNLPVEDAIKRWTNGVGYSIPLGDLRGKKVKDLDPSSFDKLVNTITSGEDGKYYKKPTPQANIPTTTPVSTSPAPSVPQILLNIPEYKIDKIPTLPIGPDPETVTPDPLGRINPPQERNIRSNVRGMNLLNILPELYQMGTNHEEPVPLQQYNPLLEQPYQVSFQDRINQNTSTLRSIQKLLPNNPTALASIAAQNYQANNAVQADEFRFNQGEANRVYNQNRNTLNDAQLRNLQLSDQQFVRQSTGRSKTKAQTAEILSSLSNKYLQNQANNQHLAYYENLYDYRFNDSNQDGLLDQAQYEGTVAQFNWGDTGASSSNNFSSSREVTKNGVPVQTVTSTPSPVQQQLLQLRLENEQNKKPLINIPSIFRKTSGRR